MAINTGKSLRKTIETINEKINLCYNRNVESSPYELLNQYSVLDLFKIKRGDLQKSISCTNKANHNQIRGINRRRTNYKYKEQEKIFIKNWYKKDKLEPRWTGPYEITQVNNNWVKYKKKGREESVNIKNIRPE